jgi:hypothetical protein
MKTTDVGVFIALQDNNQSDVFVTHGKATVPPYFQEAKDEKSVVNYYTDRGASEVMYKLVDPYLIHEYMEKLAKKFIQMIGPGIHALTHESGYVGVERYNLAGNMFYMRHVAFAYAASSGKYQYFIQMREDNVFLSPFASLSDIVIQLEEKAKLYQLQSSTSTNSSIISSSSNMIGSGGQVALDQHCDAWGGYSDKSKKNYYYYYYYYYYYM